jgi:hypothetical protein
MPGTIYLYPHIERMDLKTNLTTLFVFGDNMMQRGLGSQAKEMRGEPNAIGIPTKWSPGTNIHDYFINPDIQRADVRGRINSQFKKLEKHLKNNGDIVFPKNGIGTGLSQLEQRAPKVLEYIELKIRELYKITEE